MLVTVATRFKTFIVSLNLFNSESEDSNVERLERISTRIYLILLTISFLILLTYTSVVERTSTITVDSPSQTIIEQLFEEYSESINCPCTNIAISYDKIIQIDVTYHQICSSPLLTSEWIKNAYLVNTTYIWPRDIRTLASMYAQIFASFCSISKAQMDVGLSTFKSSPLITTNVIKSSLLSTQIQTQINIFNQTITEDINTLHTGIQVTTRGNQLASGLQTANVWYISQSDDEDMILTSETIWYQYDQVTTDELGCFCDTITYCTVQTYFYSDIDYYSLADYGRSTYDGMNHPIEIEGWATGCYPMQGLYATKLNCYYNRTCLALLFDSPLESIPVLRLESNQTRFGSPNRYTTKTLMRNLFVENFHLEVFFDKLLRECAPRFCTYTLTHKANILQIISTIFGLFGGVSTALKLFVQQILLRFLNWRYKRTLTRGTNQGNNLVRRGLTWNSFQRLSSMVRNKIVELNLFSENSIIGREKIERQRWTTRLFVLSLAIAFSTLTIYTALGEHTKMIIISSPNQSHYENLLMFHPSIRCPCTSISIKYEQFLNTSPTFHQICSSDFQNWNFYQWLNVNASLDTRDFRFSAVSYFALLEHLCAQVEITVEESYNHFIKNEYITDILLTSDLFSIEASTLINTLIQKTTNQFVQITQTTRQLTAASQFISKYQTSSSSRVTPDYEIYLIQKDFHSDRLFSNQSCFCGRNLTCQRPAAVYDIDRHDLIETIDGLIFACLPFESLLASNFICFYNATCVNRTFSWFDNNVADDEYGLEDRIYRPLLDSNLTSRFNQTSTVEEIIYNLFIEDWNAQYSYSAFFNSCNISYCSYSINERNNLLIIITTLIGLFGGLDVALELILPFIVNFLAYCKRKFSRNNAIVPTENNNNQMENSEQDIEYIFTRMKLKLINLNLFENNNNNDDIHQIHTQKFYTRLYIIFLFITVLSFIIYYGFIDTHTVTITVDEPSITKFKELHDLYSDTLHCPSLYIAIDYELFTQYNYTTHQICSSEFISTEFTDFLYDFIQYPMIYNVKDFRRQAVYLFHVLRTLCSLSRSAVDATLKQFLLKKLIASEVLSQEQFNMETQGQFDTLRHSISATFILHLDFFRTFVQGNQLQTLSMSNWKFNAFTKQLDDNVQTLPITYGETNCSCAISNLCYETAKIFLNNSSIIHIPGIEVGCTPLEALLASTLTVFYNQTFIDYLIRMLNFNPPKALKLSLTSRYKYTDLIETLVNDSFIEFWNITANYSKYYEYSQPNQCTYSYTTRNDAVFVTNTLLGLYGGLTVTLHFIVPYLVNSILRIKRVFC